MVAIANRPQRLPDERQGFTRRFKIPYTLDDGTLTKLKVYVSISLYDDGRLGEIFIRADKVGSFMSGALDTVAMLISIALQHGVPIEAITTKLRRSKFGPSGLMPWDDDIKSCTSPFDAIAHWLELKFCKPSEVAG